MMVALFVHPLKISFYGQLYLLLPLCLAVATVYKTIRTAELRRLHIEILIVMAYMVAGLLVLGLALWLIHTCWP